MLAASWNLCMESRMMRNNSKRGAGVLAAAILAIGGMAWPAGAATAAVAGGHQPRARAFLSVQGQLVSVATVSARNVWAVGDNTAVQTRPILAHFDGKRWTDVKSPALPSRGRLFGVAKFPGGAWAVGFSGAGAHQPLILRLTGATARRVPAPRLRGELLGVSATSATNAWAVGETGRSALILHWNGRMWARMQLPGNFAAGDLSRVAATSTRNAWAIGDGRHGNQVIMHWNGKRWSSTAFPAPGGKELQLLGLTATSAADAWAVGFTGGITTSSVTVALHWDGKKWKRVPSQDPLAGGEGDGFLGVGASSPHDAWAVGGGFTGLDGAPLTQHWDGTSLKSVPTPGGTGNLLGVSIGASGQAWAVGQTLAPTEAEGTMTLILHWDGTAWH
jgi:hypothetical protein